MASGAPCRTIFRIVMRDSDDENHFHEVPPEVLAGFRTSKAVDICAGPNCFKRSGDPGVQLLTCVKCKNPRYCSKECQRNDWSVHKDMCKDASSLLSRMIHRFISDPACRFVLALALVNEFKLNQNLILEPLMVECEVAVEPVDETYTQHFKSGQLSQSQLDRGTKGVFQVKTLVPLNAQKMMDANLWQTWAGSKKQAADDGNPNTPVVLIDFIRKDTIQTYVHPMKIFQNVIESVNCGVRFSVGGEERPLSATSCLDFINDHIRCDIHNKSRLHTHMQRYDVEKFCQDSPEALMHAMIRKMAEFNTD